MSTRRYWFCFLLTLLCACVQAAAPWKIEKLGIPVQAVTYGNSHATLAPGPGGKGRMFYTSYYCSTGAELVGCDYTSGQMVRKKLPAKGGYAVAAGPDNAIYIGGVYPGDLYRYDPSAEKLTTVAIKQFGVEYIWDAALGKDGKMYCAAGYPQAKLVVVDPASGAAKDLGVMAPGEQYLRSLCVDARGKVWCGIGTKAHLVVYNPEDGSKREVLTPDLAGNSMVGRVEAVGKFVLASVIFDGVLLVYDAETGALVRRIPTPEKEGMAWGLVEGSRGGTAYLQTGLSQDLYQCELSTGKLTVVAKGIGQAQIIDQDRWVHLVDDQEYVVYDLHAAKTVFRKRLKEGGDGMQIFSLTRGPGGDIYGSTYINMRFFRFSPGDGKLVDLGKASRWPGQIDSLSLGSDGRIYIGSYINAVLSVYDPKLPWRPGPESGDNPFELGPIGYGQYRTKANCLGPDGKLYAGSIPSYKSSTVGAFAICDLHARAMTVNTNLVRGGAVEHLVSDDQFVYGAGGGEFFVFDPKTCGKRHRHERPCTALALLKNGKVVGSGRGRVFLYDTKTDQFEEQPNVAGDFSHMASGGGVVFGINGNRVARITETSDAFAVEVVALEGGTFAATDTQGRVYFARGAELFRCFSPEPPR